MNWNQHARRILKAELARQGVTYGRLASKLRAIGVRETERSIGNKMSRGTFSFVFYLQCLAALGLEKATTDLSLAMQHLNARQESDNPGPPPSSGPIPVRPAAERLRAS